MGKWKKYKLKKKYRVIGKRKKEEQAFFRKQMDCDAIKKRTCLHCKGKSNKMKNVCWHCRGTEKVMRKGVITFEQWWPPQ